MNDQQMDNKVHKDVAKVKKDLNTLAEDGATQVSRLEDKVSQVAGKTKKDLTTWVEDGVTQLNEEFVELADDAKVTVVGAVATVKKEVGQGLSQYNAKAQEVANKIPGGFSEKASRYPWVAISIALVVGFILGSLLKPTQHSLR